MTLNYGDCYKSEIATVKTVVEHAKSMYFCLIGITRCRFSTAGGASEH